MASTGTRSGVADAPIDEGTDQPKYRRRMHPAPMMALTATTLLASLVTLTPAGAAEEAAGESASGTATASADPTLGDVAGGVEVVRYTGSDQYALSLAVAQVQVDAGDGTSELVVLASGRVVGRCRDGGSARCVVGRPGGLGAPGRPADTRPRGRTWSSS